MKGRRTVLITAASLWLAAAWGAYAQPPTTGAFAPHQVVILASDNDYQSPTYAAKVWSYTGSGGAPVIAIGANTADAVGQLMDAGFHVEPALSPGVYWITFVK